MIGAQSCLKSISSLSGISIWEKADECVVYDDKTGETLLLNPLEWIAVSLLLATEDEFAFHDWVAQVAGELTIESVDQVAVYLESLATQLSDVGFLSISNS